MGVVVAGLGGVVEPGVVASSGNVDVGDVGTDGCDGDGEVTVDEELIVDEDAVDVVSSVVTTAGGVAVGDEGVDCGVDVLANVVVVVSTFVSVVDGEIVGSGGSALLGAVGDVGVVSAVNRIGVVVVGSAVVVGIVVGGAVGDAMGDAVGDAVDGDEVASVVKPSVVYSVVESVALYSVVL